MINNRIEKRLKVPKFVLKKIIGHMCKVENKIFVERSIAESYLKLYFPKLESYLAPEVIEEDDIDEELAQLEREMNNY